MQCGGNGYTYAGLGGQIACPLPAPSGVGLPFTAYPIVNGGYEYPTAPYYFVPPANATQLSCATQTWSFPTNPNLQMTGINMGMPYSSGPIISMPCVFACHNDPSKPAGQGNDYFALARATIGSANPITLRIDQLKVAVNQMLNQMAAINTASSALTVGIYTFAMTATQVYPTAGEAGSDFSAAIAAVGLPPNAPSQPDTGIQPPDATLDPGHSETNFPASMAALAQIVSASGNGNSPQTPRKALIIVTDGFEDAPTAANPSHGDYGPFATDQCTAFKNMGYQIYVVYTAYYPIMWAGWYTWAGGPVINNQIAPALQACSSGPGYYLQVTDGPGLSAALQTFLRSAANAPTVLTQ